jgi:hypothetical protein
MVCNNLTIRTTCYKATVFNEIIPPGSETTKFEKGRFVGFKQTLILLDAKLTHGHIRISRTADYILESLFFYRIIANISIEGKICIKPT